MRKGSWYRINYGLKFYKEVLGAEELHFGYFPEKCFKSEEFSFDELKKAQRDYTLHLLSYVPSSVCSILDVGCGFGNTASILGDRGYKVTCLSPDEYQEKIIKQKYPSLSFIRTKFEDFKTSKHFDLILMSESVQYLNLEIAYKNTKRLLNPSGYLLLSDYFRKSNSRYYHHCKVIDKHLEILQKNSFSLVVEEDITEYVLPTLDFSNYYYNKYAIPSLNIFEEYIQTRVSKPWIMLAKLLFKKQLNKLTYYLGPYTAEKFDRYKFKENISYIIQLWQNNES